MTRPMPGPPEHRLTAHPHGDDGWCPICHHLTARRPYDPSKRLTNAECVDHWDAAEQEASYALLRHALGDKRVTAQDVEQSSHVAATWPRFTIRPHALEVTL